MDRLWALNVAVLTGKELITRLERTRELRIVRRQMLIGFIKRVSCKRLIAVAPVVIDATLCEVLVNRLVEQKLVGREVSNHIQHTRIWKRVLVEIWSDRRMNRDVLGN